MSKKVSFIQVFIFHRTIIISVYLLVSDNDRSHECNAEMYVERKASGASAKDRDAMILHVHIRDIIVNISDYMAS